MKIIIPISSDYKFLSSEAKCLVNKEALKYALSVWKKVGIGEMNLTMNEFCSLTPNVEFREMHLGELK